VDFIGTKSSVQNMAIPFPKFTELLVYVHSGGPSLCRKYQDGGEASPLFF